MSSKSFFGCHFDFPEVRTRLDLLPFSSLTSVINLNCFKFLIPSYLIVIAFDETSETTAQPRQLLSLGSLPQPLLTLSLFLLSFDKKSKIELKTKVLKKSVTALVVELSWSASF
jgi:hypothetical protein